MGKSLIIKGADFSVNGIAAEYQRLSWVGMPIVPGVYTDSGIIFANADPNNPYDELEFCITIDSSKITHEEGGWESGFRSMGSAYNTMTTCHVWFGYSFVAFIFDGKQSQKSTYSYRTLSDGNQHTFKINRSGGTIDDDSTTFIFDSPADLTQYSAAQLASGSVYLDSRRVSSGSENYLHASSEDAVKIHWVKYRRNGEVILDAIPVKRNSDNKIGFYDKVSGQYMFRNDGSTPAYGTL